MNSLKGKMHHIFMLFFIALVVGFTTLFGSFLFNYNKLKELDAFYNSAYISLIQIQSNIIKMRQIETENFYEGKENDEYINLLNKTNTLFNRNLESTGSNIYLSTSLDEKGKTYRETTKSFDEKLTLLKQNSEKVLNDTRFNSDKNIFIELEADVLSLQKLAKSYIDTLNELSLYYANILFIMSIIFTVFAFLFILLISRAFGSVISKKLHFIIEGLENFEKEGLKGKVKRPKYSKLEVKFNTDDEIDLIENILLRNKNRIKTLNESLKEGINTTKIDNITEDLADITSIVTNAGNILNDINLDTNENVLLELENNTNTSFPDIKKNVLNIFSEDLVLENIEKIEKNVNAVNEKLLKNKVEIDSSNIKQQNTSNKEVLENIKQTLLEEKENKVLIDQIVNDMETIYLKTAFLAYSLETEAKKAGDMADGLAVSSENVKKQVDKNMKNLQNLKDLLEMHQIDKVEENLERFNFEEKEITSNIVNEDVSTELGEIFKNIENLKNAKSSVEIVPDEFYTDIKEKYEEMAVKNNNIIEMFNEKAKLLNTMNTAQNENSININKKIDKALDEFLKAKEILQVCSEKENEKIEEFKKITEILE